MSAIAMSDELSPGEHLRMIGQVQMMRFQHPDWTPERIADAMGVKPMLVRAWAFRETLAVGLGRGLSQYRYPKPGEEPEEGDG